MFYDTAVEDKSGDRPQDLRNNIFSLANFIFKREIEILAKPEAKKLDILIKINRDIAGGLMTGVKNTASEAKTDSAPVATGQDAQNPDTKKPPSGGWDSSA